MIHAELVEIHFGAVAEGLGFSLEETGIDPQHVQETADGERAYASLSVAHVNEAHVTIDQGVGEQSGVLII